MRSVHTVTAISALADNYIWLIEKKSCIDALVVDPGDPRPVMIELKKRGLMLKALLITHHHTDHVAGIHTLINNYPNVQVYGPVSENIPHRTNLASEGDQIGFERLGLNFEVMELPGHTNGHIAYYEKRRKWLFSGDTIFACGCGRVFTGTHAQLHNSLTRIAELPAATQVYCAHEYTMDNIGFAKWVEPDNDSLMLFEAECQKSRQLGLPTVPTTVRRELQFNPFLRAAQPAVIAAAKQWSADSRCPLDGLDTSHAEHVFHLIRNWKDVVYD